MTDDGSDVEALVAATGYQLAAKRLAGRKRYRLAVVAALCERHLQALEAWMQPDERSACQRMVDEMWRIAGGEGWDKPLIEALTTELLALEEARAETGVDDGHPAIYAMVTIGRGFDAILASPKTGHFFSSWERDVEMPAWDPWCDQFARPGSTQALVPLGLAVDEFPRYAAGYPEVRVELEHLRCVMDAVDELEAAKRLPKRERVLARCPFPPPRWQQWFDLDRYPLPAAT